MRKGNQVKVVGQYHWRSPDGIVKYNWPSIYRHVTAEEVRAWYDSDASKGIDCAGETKLPPRCVMIGFEGGTSFQPNVPVQRPRAAKLSEDTFTVVRSRCCPVIGYHKQPKSALVRNNRTGAEGYVKRKDLELVQ
jgi:hypothetical protein